MSVFTIFILTILIVFFVLCLSTIVVNYPRYSYYKKTYDALVSGEYVYSWSGHNQFYFIHKNETDIFSGNGIIFFDNPDKRDIKLLGYLNYIHGGTLTYMDPYTWFWSKKIWKWYDSNSQSFNDDLTKKNENVSKETPTSASDNLQHYK